MLDAPFADTTRSKSCLPFFGCGEQSEQGASASAFNQPRAPDVSQLGMKPFEDFLASEMNKLSVQERSKALDDVHCVGDDLHETSEIIEKSLVEFEQVLQQAKNPIYEMAKSQNRAYVENPEFRLKFLRATLHDVGRSVRNMLEFLKFKATYFGNEKVARDITVDDLNEEDMQLLFSGIQHIQDGTDQMGRFILYFVNIHMGKGEIGTHVRVTYFIMFNILASMPAVQKKGIVSCYYDLSKPGENVPKPSFNFLVSIVNFLNCVPVRVSAHHACLRAGNGDNVALNKFILGLAMKIFPHTVRVRTTVHYGTDMEFQYDLQGHGIPSDTFPFDANGNMRQDIQNVWFYKHQALESLNAESPRVDEVKSNIFSSPDNAQGPTSGCKSPTKPPRHDILLGRGRPIQSNPGNVCFREYLKQYIVAYDEAPRNLRRKVLLRIREDLNGRGIRFLQERNGVWVECSAAEAEKTISQAFRNLRKKSKKEDI